MLNKKGLVGDAISWAVVTLVIFFIMVAYTIGIAAITASGTLEKKIVVSANYNQEFYTDIPNNVYIDFSLARFLNKRIDTNSYGAAYGMISIKNFILRTLDPYIDENNLYYDYADSPVVGKMSIVKSAVLPLEDVSSPELVKALQTELDKVCDEYILVTPLGVFGRIKISERLKEIDATFLQAMKFEDLKAIQDDKIEAKIKNSFTPWIEYQINYRGKLFIIKYSQKSGC